MTFTCANADLIQNKNLDVDYDYITFKAKSLTLAVESLANSFAKSKSDCVLFVWNTDDPYDLPRATEQACLEDVDFKKIIDELKNNLDYSVLGDFDLASIELENGFTISVVKYVTMNNLKESKKSLTEKELKMDVWEWGDVKGTDEELCNHIAEYAEEKGIEYMEITEDEFEYLKKDYLKKYKSMKESVKPEIQLMVNRIIDELIGEYSSKEWDSLSAMEKWDIVTRKHYSFGGKTRYVSEVRDLVIENMNHPFNVVFESKKSMKESFDSIYATSDMVGKGGKEWLLEGSYNFVMEFLEDWGIAPFSTKTKGGKIYLYDHDGNEYGFYTDEDGALISITDEGTNYAWKNNLNRISTKNVKVYEESKKPTRKSIKESDDLTRYDMIGEGFFVLINADINSFCLCEQLGDKTQDTNILRSFDTEKQARNYANKKGLPIVEE